MYTNLKTLRDNTRKKTPTEMNNKQTIKPHKTDNKLLPPTDDAFRHPSSYLSNILLVNVMLPKPTTTDPIKL